MRYTTRSLPFRLMAAVTLTSAFAPALYAQERQVWIQIEAKPNLAQAMERAQAFGQSFPQTHGFEMTSGWFSIALGPYPESMAVENLASLKAQGLIPSDAYINNGNDYLAQYFATSPNSAVLPANDPATAEAGELGANFGSGFDGGLSEGLSTGLAPFGLAPVDSSPLGETLPQSLGESLPEAQAFEASLDDAARRQIQEALAWTRHYSSAVDGAFGAGSRQAISQWQMAKGYGGTGVLTPLQHNELISTYLAEAAEYGFETVHLAEAGISARLPLGLVEFDRFEPPYVLYKEKNGSGMSLRLISQPGSAANLADLYAKVQNLAEVPIDGPRDLGESAFSIEGRSQEQLAYSYAQAEKGAIKGWVISSLTRHQLRDTRALEVLRQSFTATKAALDPGMVPLKADEREGLLQGLEAGGLAHYSASGIYLDGAGQVLTHATLVQDCSRITIDRLYEAKLVHQGGDLAILRPNKPLAPKAFATLGQAQAGQEIIAAGYSYGDKLPAAVTLKGRIEGLQGLAAESDLLHLSLSQLPGDTGGPVLDTSGALLGLLMPQTSAERSLPQGVAQAKSSQALMAEIAQAGLSLSKGANTPLAPHQLVQKATDMTALVSCWRD